MADDPTKPDPKPDPDPKPEPDPKPDPDTALLDGARNPDAVRNALRAEREAARAAKKQADELATKVREFEDRDKSDQQKLEERAAAAERKHGEAEAKLLRFEVAAAKKVPMHLASRLQGSTKQEIEADADALLRDLGPTAPDFDGGPRDNAPATGDMDALIRRASGRP